MPRCDHCLIEFPGREAVHDEVRGARKVFCCHGCQGVYRLINDEGLDDFYRRRRGWTPGPAAPAAVDLSAFTGNLRQKGDEIETDIVLDGIRCASCVWLNEKVLARTEGVTFAQVNYATHRARIRWDPRRTALEAVLRRIISIGYTPRPFVARAFEEEQRRASRDLLVRFGTAGFLSMQLMLFSAALYAGYFQGIDPGLKELFHWIELALTTPVVFYAGRPFFAGAARGLRNLAFNMDVLIAAGSGSAYLYSIYRMFSGGEVFFDTAAMIITLILLGRFLEAGAKRKASEAISRLLSLAPGEARQVVQGKRTMVPVSGLAAGDLVEVVPGERLPLDGVVTEGRSEADESMLTGESLPVAKEPGAEVFAGTVNLYGSFVYAVTRTGGDTVLNRIISAVEEAQARRAPVQALADRVVGWFVPLVMLVSVGTAVFWLLRGSGPETALMNAVSVMVIACPCALGLATPLAILTGTSFGASRGILIKGGDVIERAQGVDTIVFDKTGTVTEGRPKLTACRGIGMDDGEALTIAASLERSSEHAIGKTLVQAAGNAALYETAGFRAVPGRGVEGIVKGRQARVGSREFVAAGAESGVRSAESGRGIEELASGGATVVYLGYDGRLAGMFAVADAPRPEAAETIRLLEQSGIRTMMLTGDGKTTADAVARAVGISDVRAGRSPVEKAADLRRLKGEGRRPAMIGDGINDAPALVEADVGIAMGRATDIALESADMVLLGRDLRLVPQAVKLSRKTFAVVRQNLFWAFFYNVAAIPLAVTGILHPIVAAGAMALSSLTVVGNSLRARIS